jgi:outer membrane lipase/esterase
MTRFAKLLVGLVAWVGIAASASAYSGLYVFGDSLSDSGNIAAAIGTDPSQVITGDSYIPSKPYASGTFSNAAVWVTPFATALGLAPWSLPSLLGGGDYAFGGARMALDGPGEPPSLVTQVGMFLSDHTHVAPASALYVVAGGGNDARDAFAAAAAASTPLLRLQIIHAAAVSFAQDATEIIDTLQAAGAQQIVV